MPGKIIVTNRQVLSQKYGAAGLTAINRAVAALVAADARRGITTTVKYVDDPALGSHAVTNPQDCAQNKGAVDAIFSAQSPDYLMILGSCDVIPHQDLANPCYGASDPDKYAWSDLPYACSGGYSRNVKDFLNPTRVVGRLPDLTGDNEASYLVGLLNTATNYTPRSAADYAGYLGVSAQVWNASTALSIKNIFGSNSNMRQSPPDGPNWPAAEMQNRSHFFNCHGAQIDPHFYGQDTPTNFPIAHDAAYLATRVAEGTVASCECCYGAELYDPSAPGAGGQMGVANMYLREKAYAYFGSTTIAYGPASGNGAADLICQYFLQSVLSGASAGRATLEARQKFLSTVGHTAVTAVDAKTIAQFILLGDPSVHPVRMPPSPSLMAKAVTKAAASAQETDADSRSHRRASLEATGASLAESVAVAIDSTQGQVSRVLMEMVAKSVANLGAATVQYVTYAVQPSRLEISIKSASPARKPRLVQMAIARLESRHPKLKSLVVCIAIENEAGTSYQVLYSR